MWRRMLRRMIVNILSFNMIDINSKLIFEH
jgi:hypothetical protein